MRRPTETQGARIEAKIERLRADATAEFLRGRYARNIALNNEADRLEAEYRAACGVTEIVRQKLSASLASTEEAR